jgi:hypothetical protein
LLAAAAEAAQQINSTNGDDCGDTANSAVSSKRRKLSPISSARNSPSCNKHGIESSGNNNDAADNHHHHDEQRRRQQQQQPRREANFRGLSDGVCKTAKAQIQKRSKKTAIEDISSGSIVGVGANDKSAENTHTTNNESANVATTTTKSTSTGANNNPGNIDNYFGDVKKNLGDNNNDRRGGGGGGGNNGLNRARKQRGEKRKYAKRKGLGSAKSKSDVTHNSDNTSPRACDTANLRSKIISANTDDQKYVNIMSSTR